MQKKPFDIRNMIIKAFKDGIFLLFKKAEKQAKEEGKKEEKKEETILDWLKVGNHEFKRIRERVNNYVNKGWHS